VREIGISQNYSFIDYFSAFGANGIFISKNPFTLMSASDFGLESAALLFANIS